MKLIKEVEYNDVDFNWISNHYDLHLEGTCYYNGKLCYFKTEYPDFDEDSDEWKQTYTKIYSLNFLEKLSWLKTQFLFEQCVGYHWSYKSDKKLKGFYYRNPEWLYTLLFNIYFKR